MTWLEYIIKAFDNLGGISSYNDLYEEIKKIRPLAFSSQWKATVRRTIETHSSHSANYIADHPDLFYSVEGLGKGIWALRKQTQLDSPASDITEPSTKYSTQTIIRIIRDNTLVHDLKRLYKYKCQICEHSIKLNINEGYAEGHHIKPIGGPHYGPDSSNNMIIVCPNHHAELDFGAIELNSNDFKIIKHKINQEYIDYHNTKIYPYNKGSLRMKPNNFAKGAKTII